MRRAPIGLLLIALSACSGTDLVIRNVTVISAERDAPAVGMDVYVRDGRIVAVGEDLSVPGGTSTLPATGGYLIPGLIDSHVHVYHASGLRPQYTDNYAALYESYMDQARRSYLYFGYTTLIELNANYAANLRFTAGEAYPDLLHCGQGVILPNGYMALELPEGELDTRYPNYLHDTYGSDYLPPGADPAAHTPEAVVNAIAEAGGICVKLYYEEAQWFPGGPPPFALPSPEILEEMQAAADSRGMTTLLHATTPTGHRMGVETGMDVIAHGLFEWPGVAFFSQEMPEAVAKTLSLESDAGTMVQPTFQTMRNTASMFEPDSLTDPLLGKVLPQGYLEYLATEAQVQREVFMQNFGSAIDPQAGVKEMAMHQEAFNRRFERAMAQLDKNGAKFLFGTDTAVGGLGWGNPPGLNGYREMQAWQRAGIALQTIFEAATLRNAEAFGLDDELGSITPGKQADLLLLRENPLGTLSAYDAIDWVINNGVPYQRTEFSASNDH